MQVKKQQSEPCMEQLIGSRLRKEYSRLLSPCLFNLYAEHIMRSAGLNELLLLLLLLSRFSHVRLCATP